MGARTALAFATITLIWGSTWLVIHDQLGVVSPYWSVAYRFILGTASAFAWAAATRTPLRLGRDGQRVAVLLGATQFLLNYNLVYLAEQHVTSGLVAVTFALLVVPNALLGWLLLGQRITPRFAIGSLVAFAGVALLFAQEMRGVAAGGRDIGLGIVLTLGAILAASIANVVQAMPIGRGLPVMAMLAWAMLWGALMTIALALALAGPPGFDPRPGYALGLVYLGVVASSLAFSLYYSVIRAIGPARAAYSSVIIPILAMGLSTLFEDYRWSPLAAAGAVLTLAGLLIAIRARSPAR